MNLFEIQLFQKGGEVFSFNERRMIRVIQSILIRVMIASAVRDNSVVGGEGLNLRIPGAVIAYAAVKQYQSLTLPLRDVIKFDAIHLNLYRLDGLLKCLRQ